jgi:hypothetical protein
MVPGPAEQGLFFAGQVVALREQGAEISSQHTRGDAKASPQLPRQNGDFRCQHFIMERGPISAMFRFECALDLEVITVAAG